MTNVSMKNSIYVKRALKVVVNQGQNELPMSYVATALKNIESLGFTFSASLVDAIKTLSPDEFVTFYTSLVTDLKQMVGAHVQHKPMYPNFPQQVMETSEVELYINAILHYLTHSLPERKEKERFPLLDNVKLKVIDLGSDGEFYALIRSLISANTSISASDKEDINWIIANTDDTSCYLPETIPFKETMCFVVPALLKHEKATFENVAPYVKTANDVMRLAAALSDGDISLKTNIRFRKFKRPERRFLLGLLEKAPNLKEDMLQFKRRWIRLGEILHPSEYASRYPKANQAFSAMRNNEKVETFASKFEDSLKKRDVKKAVDTLSKRPGEFARRIDHLLQLSKENEELVTYVVERFAQVAKNVSSPVLLQVMAHFKHRHEDRDLRTFFPRGNVAKVVGVENNLPSLQKDTCGRVVLVCEDALKARFSSLPPLGKSFIEEELSRYLVPFSQRSASKSLRTLVRGSQIDLPSEGDTVRFFLWWKEGLVNGQSTGTVDIDLSATMFSDEWSYRSHVSFTNIKLREPKEDEEDIICEDPYDWGYREPDEDSKSSYIAYHSGDIVTAPKGASEFIDVDIAKARKHNIRYVIMSLHSYSGQPYKDLPECFAGWMMRQEPNSGEIYEPATVVDKVDLAADTGIAIPVVLDLEERKLIWCDLSLTQHVSYHNTIEGNLSSMALLGKSMTSLVKPTLYDLFRLHVEARGERVESLEEAEQIFSLENGITPFHIETIMSEYLS